MKNAFLLSLFVFLFLTQNSLTAQVRHFQGTWTLIGTTYVFEFDLILEHENEHEVKGYFNWKVVRYDENDLFSREYYQPKLGYTAKEFVRGQYDPKTRQYFLKGYQKDDPHQIISTDTYRLQLDENGDIGGDTNAHNTWKGRINGKAVSLDDA